MPKKMGEASKRILEYAKLSVRRNKEARRPVEWRWYENAAFAAGFSNVEYDPRRGRPSVVAGSDDESSNPMVMDKIRKYHAKLTAPKPIPDCIPITNDREARKRAEFANSLILHFWESKEYLYADHAAKLNMLIFGNGFWAMQWDTNAGEWVESYEYEGDIPVYETLDIPEVDEFGQPILIDRPMGNEKKTISKFWQSGLPRLRSVHPFNFFPDPHWRHLTKEQCMNYAERRLIPKDIIQTFYPDVDMDGLDTVNIADDTFLYTEADSILGIREPDSLFEKEEMIEVWDFYNSPFIAKPLGLEFE